MIEILLAFWLMIVLLLLPLFVCWRILRPKKPMSHLAALLLKEIIMGVWHWLFGAKKMRVIKRRKRRRRN